jgi:hypothetical protein
MQLIPISDDILINPDKISTVEIRKRKGSTSIAIVVEGRTHEVTVNPGMLLAELKRVGVDMSKQFFAV